MHESALTVTAGLPVVMQLNNMEPDAFITWYHGNHQTIEHRLHEKGAVKFSGVQIGSLEDFQHIVNSVSDKFLSYIDGNSPRTKLSGNVYTSTEYDQTQQITMHNELSYSARWPGKLFFCCLQVAGTGGETLLADSREILRRMNREIVTEVASKGVTYIRNLHGGRGMGPSWQDTFETGNKQQVEAYCAAYGMDIQWRENDSLRLKQTRRGIIPHRITGEQLWFNQIDQFHPCHLGADMFGTLELMYHSPEYFPMYVTFGNGDDIHEDTVHEIMRTIGEATIAPAWHTNEFLIVDNELVCHGRNPYTGNRRVLVAMSE